MLLQPEIRRRLGANLLIHIAREWTLSDAMLQREPQIRILALRQPHHDRNIEAAGEPYLGRNDAARLHSEQLANHILECSPFSFDGIEELPCVDRVAQRCQFIVFALCGRC